MADQRQSATSHGSRDYRRGCPRLPNFMVLTVATLPLPPRSNQAPTMLVLSLPVQPEAQRRLHPGSSIQAMEAIWSPPKQLFEQTTLILSAANDVITAYTDVASSSMSLTLLVEALMLPRTPPAFNR